MNRKGFTLIEMLIVIAIIAILLAISTINFNTWLTRYRVQKQTKEMHSDFSTFRLRAMQQKVTAVIWLGPLQYELRTYRDGAAINRADPNTLIETKVLDYEIRDLNAPAAPLDITVNSIQFDERGMTNNNFGTRIMIFPAQIFAGDSCIIVANARTNIGRMTDAATCTPR